MTIYCKNCERNPATYSFVVNGKPRVYCHVCLEAFQLGQIHPYTSVEDLDLNPHPDDEMFALYIESGAGHCPKCRDSAIEGGSIDIEGDFAYQKVMCTECDFEWTDVYKLAHAFRGGI